MWGTFAGTLVNVRDALVNMVLWVRQSSPEFAKLRQTSHEGAHMLLVHPGTCLRLWSSGLPGRLWWLVGDSGVPNVRHPPPPTPDNAPQGVAIMFEEGAQGGEYKAPAMRDGLILPSVAKTLPISFQNLEVGIAIGFGKGSLDGGNSALVIGF